MKVDVVREAELKPGASTEGIVRKKAFESENVLVGQSHVAGGVVSDWHHHGARHLYGFIVSGRLRLEYGPKRVAVEIGPGDYFHIPAGLVHRDLNPDRVVELVVVNILVGEGPTVVNVRVLDHSTRAWGLVDFDDIVATVNLY